MSGHQTDHIDDDLLRRALNSRNPAHGKPIPAFTLTPEQLRAHATETAPPRRTLSLARPTRRQLVTGTVAVIAAAAGYLLWPNPAFAAPAPLELDWTEPPTPAADKLVQIADELRRLQPADTSPYPTTYVHLQRWSVDTVHDDGIIAHDIKLWWHPDRSGHELYTTLPPQRPHRRTAEYLTALPAGSRTTTIRYQPGEFSDLTGTPSTHPDELKSQLDSHQPPANGPHSTIRAIADITSIHHLNTAQRLAVLTVLARTPGLAWRGHTRDRAGRPCHAISIDTGTHTTGKTRNILLIDNQGAILGNETIALTAPPNTAIPAGTVTEYTLNLRLTPQAQ